MSSQFLRYERVAVETVNRMYELIDKADTFPSNLEYPAEAAMTGCNALKRFTVDSEFYNDLILPYWVEYSPVAPPLPSNVSWPNPLREWEKLHADMNEFNRFLKIEREVLVKGGIEPGVADILIFRCRDIMVQRVSQKEAQEALAQLQEAACGEAATLQQQIQLHIQQLANDERHRRTMGILRRVLIGVGGVAMVGLNLGAAAVTAGLSSVASGLSISLAGTIVTSIGTAAAF